MQTDNLFKQIDKLNTLGVNAKTQGKFTVAKNIFQQALGMSEHLVENQRLVKSLLWCNLGASLWHLGEFEESETAFNQAIAHGYEDATLYHNLGLLLTSQKRYEEALIKFDQALKLDPRPNIKVHKSLVYLAMGNWKKGWIEYDNRLTTNDQPIFDQINLPTWKGEDLNNQSLFVVSEEGFGDNILFSRYLSWILEQWPSCQINFHCHHPSLHDLFAKFPVILHDEYNSWQTSNYKIALQSLPRLHNTIINNVPKDPGWILKAVNSPKKEQGLYKVGICWSGDPKNARQKMRSIPSELLFSLQDIPNIEIVDLQKLNKNTTWLETANDMINLDLVISVDTAIAHLAGALKLETWLLLASSPYWVWLETGNKTNWYPTMTLFRQEESGDWNTVIKQIRERLINKFVPNQKETKCLTSNSSDSII